MQITRTSPLTGKVHTLDLPVTQDQMDAFHRRDDLIQRIFPNLSPEEREFIKSGITDEEWQAHFAPLDDE
jgi:hypothetical protein